jgi:hypothetical protein
MGISMGDAETDRPPVTGARDAPCSRARVDRARLLRAAPLGLHRPGLRRRQEAVGELVQPLARVLVVPQRNNHVRPGGANGVRHHTQRPNLTQNSSKRNMQTRIFRVETEIE